MINAPRFYVSGLINRFSDIQKERLRLRIDIEVAKALGNAALARLYEEQLTEMEYDYCAWLLWAEGV